MAGVGRQNEIIDLSLSDDEVSTHNATRYVAPTLPTRALSKAAGTGISSRRPRDTDSQQSRPSFLVSRDLASHPESPQTRPSHLEPRTAKSNRSDLASSVQLSLNSESGRSDTQNSPPRSTGSQDRARSHKHTIENGKARTVIDFTEPEESSRPSSIIDNINRKPYVTAARTGASSDRSVLERKRLREDDPLSRSHLPERKKQKFEGRPLYGSSATHEGAWPAHPSSAQKRAKFQLNEVVRSKKQPLSDSRSSQAILNSVVDLTMDESVDESLRPRGQLDTFSTHPSTEDSRTGSPSKAIAIKRTAPSSGRRASVSQEEKRLSILEQFQRRVSEGRDGTRTTAASDSSITRSSKGRTRSPSNRGEPAEGRRISLTPARSSSANRGFEIPESLPGSPANSERALDTEAPRHPPSDPDTPRKRRPMATNGIITDHFLNQPADTLPGHASRSKHDIDNSQDALVRQSTAAEFQRHEAATGDNQEELSIAKHVNSSGGLTSPRSTNGTTSPARKPTSSNGIGAIAKSPARKPTPAYPLSPSETTSEENSLSRERTPKQPEVETALRQVTTISTVTMTNLQQSPQWIRAQKTTPLSSSVSGANDPDRSSFGKGREPTAVNLKAPTQRQARQTDGKAVIDKRSDLVHQETGQPKTHVMRHSATDVSSAVRREQLMALGGHAVGSGKVPALPNQSPSTRVEQVVGYYIGEMQQDNEHWARTTLRRARLSAETRPPLDEEKPTDVFSKMQPMTLVNVTKAPTSKKLDGTYAKFSVEVGKVQTKWALHYKPISTSAQDVPSYSHYVSIKNNLLAHNDPTLQHWPYFGDGFAMENASSLEAQYSLDIVGREKKLLDLARADTSAPYAEDMLEELGCTWSEILYFLLHQNPLPNLERHSPANQALERRNEFCESAFRTSPRWSALVSSLPEPEQENIEKAALLCDHFQKLLKLSLWHVVRRSAFTNALLEKQHQPPEMAKLTCRVCMRFDCPYHGEIKDTDVSPSNGDEASTNGSEEGNAVETDIVHPPDINKRTRVTFPPSLETQDAPGSGKDRRSVAYWQTGPNASLKFRPDVRGPFYGCYHPKESCTTAKCSCYENQIPCEKTCACSPGCLRKFQGCNCASEKSKSGHRLVCFESDACACFQHGRECDPDLCGECGVCDVVDPVYRHNDHVLVGRCRNANMQRGVAKHTILGDSGVHGLGLYACEPIQQHEFVGEYRGEIIQKDEADRRGAVYEHQKLSYLFSLNNTQEIDSTYFGTRTRFINHAPGTKANIYPRIIMVNAVHRIALYGNRPIAAGEELFFDYGPQFPQDQLGGKTSRKQSQQSKAAPHVRNAGLVFDFPDVEQEEDEMGNVRARPASKIKRLLGRPAGGKLNPKQQLGPRGDARPGAGRVQKVLPPEDFEIPKEDMAFSGRRQAGRDVDEPELDGYPQDPMLHDVKDNDPDEPEDDEFQLPSEGSFEEEAEDEESGSNEEEIEVRGRGRLRLPRS